MCGKGCASEHDDKEHLDLKNGDLNIVCSSWNLTFLNKDTLKIHQETEHKKELGEIFRGQVVCIPGNTA